MSSSKKQNKVSISNQKGKVKRLFYGGCYGFIHSDKHGDVYFTTGDLIGCQSDDLHSDDDVNFDAVPGPPSASNAWKATRVWKSKSEYESLTCVKAPPAGLTFSTPVKRLGNLDKSKSLDKSKVVAKALPDSKLVGKSKPVTFSKSELKTTVDKSKLDSELVTLAIKPPDCKWNTGKSPQDIENKTNLTCENKVNTTILKSSCTSSKKSAPTATNQSKSPKKNSCMIKTDVEHLTGETGVISTFSFSVGFIKSDIHGLVCFHWSVVDYNPCLGDSVIFNAVPGPKNAKSKWKATKVSLNKLTKNALQSEVSGILNKGTFREENCSKSGNGQTNDDSKTKSEISNTDRYNTEVAYQTTDEVDEQNCSEEHRGKTISSSEDMKHKAHHVMFDKKKYESKQNASKGSIKLSSDQQKQSKATSGCVNQVGVISKLCYPVGFIEAQLEGMGGVCFHLSAVDCKCSVGDSVIFDAVIGPPNKSNKWKATKVSKFKSCKTNGKATSSTKISKLPEMIQKDKCFDSSEKSQHGFDTEYCTESKSEDIKDEGETKEDDVDDILESKENDNLKSKTYGNNTNNKEDITTVTQASNSSSNNKQGTCSIENFDSDNTQFEDSAYEVNSVKEHDIVSNTSLSNCKLLTYKSGTPKTSADVAMTQNRRQTDPANFDKTEQESNESELMKHWDHNRQAVDCSFKLSNDGINSNSLLSFKNDHATPSMSKEEESNQQSKDILKTKGLVVSTDKEYGIIPSNQESIEISSPSFICNGTTVSISSSSDGTDVQTQNLRSVGTDIDIKQFTVLYINQSELTLLLREQYFKLYKIDRKKAVSHQDLNIPKNISRGDIIILPNSNISRLSQDSTTVTESVSFPVASSYSTTFAKVEQIVNNTIFLKDYQSNQAFRYTFHQTRCIASCLCGCLSRHVLQGDLFKIVTSSETCYDGSKPIITLTPVQEILRSVIKFQQLTIQPRHFEHSSHDAEDSIINGRGFVQCISSTTLVISMLTGEVILCTDKEVATLWSLQVGDVVKFNAVTSDSTPPKWMITFLALEYFQHHQGQMSIECQEVEWTKKEKSTVYCTKCYVICSPTKDAGSQTVSTGHVVISKVHSE